MKNILLILLAALLLFSISAALSLYLQSPGARRDEGREKVADKAGDRKGDTDEKKNGTGGEVPPPVVQQPTTTTSEEAARLLGRLKERTAALTKREEEVRRQEQRLQIVMDDIRGERAALDTLRKQFSDELKRLTDRQDKLAKNARSLEEQKAAAAKLLADMEKRTIEMGKTESSNLTRMASISDSMPPEKAAVMLKQLADGGQLDTAVKLLGQMRERRAAQVLAEMTDVALAAQLMEKLRGLRRPGMGTPATPPTAPTPGGTL